MFLLSVLYKSKTMSQWLFSVWTGRLCCSNLTPVQCQLMPVTRRHFKPRSDFWCTVFIYGRLSAVLFLTGTVTVSPALCRPSVFDRTFWHISVSRELLPGIILYRHNSRERWAEGQERKRTQHAETRSASSPSTAWTLPPSGSTPDRESCSLVTDQLKDI